jgi:hypothetical protein
MDCQKVFFKIMRRNFGLQMGDGFGILANKCIYAYDVAKDDMKKKQSHYQISLYHKFVLLHSLHCMYHRLSS